MINNEEFEESVLGLIAAYLVVKDGKVGLQRNYMDKKYVYVKEFIPLREFEE